MKIGELALVAQCTVETVRYYEKAGLLPEPARTSGNFNVNPSVDTFVAIYDAAGATRLAWDDNSDGSHSDCGVTLPAGTSAITVVLLAV